MPTQNQYDVTLQKIRDIDCKIAVLDYDYALIDEISGRTSSLSISVESESDVRRTADISINLKDDISQAQNAQFYWTQGTKYWFDKYVQIYSSIEDVRTGNDVWVNQGIYCVNSPTILYDATSNTLSFQAVDLMSKMTGMRNGQLEGMTYTVPADSSITGAIEGILLEQGFTKYILYTPPQQTTPEDINIDAGSNAWDLLTQLRDINANWEMFFDIDGVFHFQQIPSGKVLVSSSSALISDMLVTAGENNIEASNGQDFEVWTESSQHNEYGEPQPLVDHTIWDKLLISANYDTNFEDVKNYIEVLGKVHTPNEFAEVSYSGSALMLKLSKTWNEYLSNSWTVEFGIQSDETGSPVALATPFTYIYMLDKNETSLVINGKNLGFLDITDDPISVGNEEYCITMDFGEFADSAKFEYIGYMQPKAIAIENNPDSPYYVGTANYYVSKTGNAVDFADPREIIISDVMGKVNNGVVTIDIRPWLSYDDIMAADVGTEWMFKVHIDVPEDGYVITAVVQTVGNTTTTRIRNMASEYISLDFNQDYMLVIARGTGSAVVVGMMYYPTPANLLPMSTTKMVNLPRFNNQVRYVCAGDEYDNIYSNDLAEQRARYEVYLRARLHDTISLNCVPIYWLDVNQIIEYNLFDESDHDMWLVKSINTDFSVDGTQSITAMRYYPLYADINLENLATQ